LKLWHEQISDLLLLAKELLIQRINVGKLLVGQLPRLVLCTASHGSPLQDSIPIFADDGASRLPVWRPGVVAEPAEALNAAAKFFGDGRREPCVDVFEAALPGVLLRGGVQREQ